VPTVRVRSYCCSLARLCLEQIYKCIKFY